MIVPATSTLQPNRLDRFRLLRARLEPAGDPTHAFSAGFYVAMAGSVSERLTAELELAPTSTHLLVGGVGSGKTTELLNITQQLNGQDDTRAIYVDVSKGHDINKLMPSAIVLQAARAIGQEFNTIATTSAEDRHTVGKTLINLGDITHGYISDYDENHDHDHDHDGWRIPGKLQPPDPLDDNTIQAQKILSLLLAPVRNRWPHLVVLLDGLDRLTDISNLEKVMRSDLKVLRELGIGTVLVGPLKALYGIDREFLEHFDSTQYQPWIDTTQARAGINFLSMALRLRLSHGDADEAALEILVRNSGGVLRDLMSLAQSACLEAYMHGSDIIAESHAVAAVDNFGRKHMQGLRSSELEVLQRVRISGSFVQTSQDDLALLMSRRVLEYAGLNEERRYVVHPTILPFLKQLAGER